MESILVQVDDEYNVSYIPLRLSEDGSSISIANEYDSKRILDSFRKRSKMIMTDNYIEDEYSKFALKSIDFYLSILSGQESFAFKVANKCSFGFLKRMRNKKRYTKKQLLAIQNFIEYEAHRELLIQGIKEEIRHR
jgi:poly-gamma-glutamate synthesis protein (capsule biosynthesis protein)